MHLKIITKHSTGALHKLLKFKFKSLKGRGDIIRGDATFIHCGKFKGSYKKKLKMGHGGGTVGSVSFLDLL